MLTSNHSTAFGESQWKFLTFYIPDPYKTKIDLLCLSAIPTDIFFPPLPKLFWIAPPFWENRMSQLIPRGRRIPCRWNESKKKSWGSFRKLFPTPSPWHRQLRFQRFSIPLQSSTYHREKPLSSCLYHG